MARKFQTVLHYLRGLAGSEQDRTDRNLLEDYVRGNQGAFASLVHRHGPMIMNVCRRMLHHPDDAEDAFQAVFLVLARKAPTLQVRGGSLGGWLYTVAYRIALRARDKSCKRSAHEVTTMSIEAPDSPDESSDLPNILDQELQSLPAKFREPIILCYLQGKTHEQAARELGWPRGSLARWIEQGCETLRKRLERRGVACSAVALTGFMANHSSAAIPEGVNHLVLNTAQLVWQGASLPPGPIVHLADNWFRAMAWGRVRSLAMLAALIAVVVGAGVFGIKASSSRVPAGAREFRLNEPVAAVCFASNGVMAAAELDTSLVFWDLKTGKRLADWMLPPEIPKQPYLAFTKDGRRIAAVSNGEKVRIWDVRTTQLVTDFGPQANVIGLAFLDHDKAILTGGDTTPITIYNVSTRFAMMHFPTAAHSPYCLSLSPDEKVLATAGNRAIQLWEVRTGKLRRVLKDDRVISRITFTPDGESLVAMGTLDGGKIEIRELHLATKNTMTHWKADPQTFNAMALSPDGKLLAVSSIQEDAKSKIVLLERGSGTIRRTMESLPSRVICLAFSDDGKTLAAGCENARVLAWSVEK